MIVLGTQSTWSRLGRDCVVLNTEKAKIDLNHETGHVNFTDIQLKPSSYPNLSWVLWVIQAATKQCSPNCNLLNFPPAPHGGFPRSLGKMRDVSLSGRPGSAPESSKLKCQEHFSSEAAEGHPEAKHWGGKRWCFRDKPMGMATVECYSHPPARRSPFNCRHVPQILSRMFLSNMLDISEGSLLV